jgi:uncharacterized protein YcsI (UPF0317 family)
MILQKNFLFDSLIRRQSKLFFKKNHMEMCLSALSNRKKLCMHSTAYDVRMAARYGELTHHTSGLARGYIQANLVILPQAWADDFLAYCKKNPQPCPVLAVSKPGVFGMQHLGKGIDLRTDLPLYRVWQHGELLGEVPDIKSIWNNDLVSFALGCSFSFESSLLDANIPLRHIEQGVNVAMYRTNIETNPVGRFGGPMVVSMRPMKAADAIKAIQITAAMPESHGAPVHFGDPYLIGIEDLNKPDFGSPVELKADEVPVFWACGVTPQEALLAARPSLCLTHAPGCMLVTDLLIKTNQK